MAVLDQFRLDGRTALITGGNRGLGKVMAEALAEAGARVAIVSRKSDDAKAAASALSRPGSGPHCGYGCDVTDADQVDAMVRGALGDLGHIDILVNNAGINIRRPIEELTPEEFRQVQETNVTGPWLVCRALARHFKERRYGKVINIGSALSIIGLAGRTPYTASKGAILQMTRTLALEWAPFQVTVNCVLPGPFATEMNLPLLNDPKQYQEFMARVPLGRWGELDEIGGLIVFLASDASRFITGAAIPIDGGWTAH